MSERGELHSMARSLRQLVSWDAEDNAPGYAFSEAAPTSEAAPANQAAPASEADTASPPTRQERPILDELRAELGDCQRCKLCGERSQLVFGEGNPDADLMFAGEAPGFYEDRSGRPFVGKGGALLDKMIGAMGLSREQVYICNVIKCRPPNNRDPEPEELIACQPFLHAQVRSVKPKVIVTLGRFASNCLTSSAEPMYKLRGRFHDYFGTKLLATYHPAYLLRNPADKGKAWADLQLVMAELGLERPGR